MRIVITGALGHIGSYLLRSLPEQFKELEIIAIDSLVTQRYFSIFNLPNIAKYQFIEADVTKANLFDLVGNADILIHLAALTDATSSFENKNLVEENNLNSTDKVANFCLESNIKLISMSSTSVYGTQEATVDENCSEDELKPQSPYAEIKLKEERLIANISKKYDFKSVIFRPGTIYGISPGMRFHTAVNKFCWQAVMNKPITVWKTAMDQKRPYLDLLDLSNAIAYVINKNLFNNEIYNVLTENLTVNEILNTIKTYSPNLTIELVDSHIMNQLSYEVLNSKIKKNGFKFCGNINKGIKDTIEQLRQSNSIFT